MWRNLKFRYIFQISPHLPCIEIWNFSTWQIFLHMWTMWQIWGMSNKLTHRRLSPAIFLKESKHTGDDLSEARRREERQRKFWWVATTWKREFCLAQPERVIRFTYFLIWAECLLWLIIGTDGNNDILWYYRKLSWVELWVEQPKI